MAKSASSRRWNRAGMAFSSTPRAQAMISCHARSEGLTLVTNNVREFEQIPALMTENWLTQPHP